MVEPTHFCKIWYDIVKESNWIISPRVRGENKKYLKLPHECFLKWWYPQNTPKWSFLVGKPMVVGETHHFRKPLLYIVTIRCAGKHIWGSDPGAPFEGFINAFSLSFSTEKRGVFSAGFFHDVKNQIHLHWSKKKFGKEICWLNDWFCFFLWFFLVGWMIGVSFVILWSLFNSFIVLRFFLWKVSHPIPIHLELRLDSEPKNGTGCVL